MDHIITADETKEIEVHSKLLDWTWTLGERLQQPENKIITNAIQKLQTQISGRFNADELLWELALVKSSVTLYHWTFTSPGVMITGTMIIFLIRLCCWKKCCQSTITQTLAYFAPSAPVASMVFNISKDPIQK
jgi:hypothetical protein